MTNAPPETTLIETMLCRHGRDFPLLGRHLFRLKSSADALGFEWPGQANIERTIRATLNDRAKGQGDWRVRLLLAPSGEVRVEAYPLDPMAQTMRVDIAPQRLRRDEPLLRLKTTFRPWYVEATAWLSTHPGFFDLIFLNEFGDVCEGSRSNVYVLKDGVWQTPPVAAGLLPGVMRSQLLESGRATEGRLTQEDLLAPGAQIRLSNGLRGWFDVTLCRTDGADARETPAKPPG